MRIFGYGSLIWDDWCDDLHCVSKKVGVLRGYRRAFNKASTRNWGTKQLPGPTLNLVLDRHSSCIGMVFEFPEENRSAVMARLEEREGKGFRFPELPVRICLSTTVSAFVPIYSGKNTIRDKTLEDIVEMIMVATGKKGRCRDYVINLHEHLRSAGINDLVIEDMASRISTKEAQQGGE